MERIMDAIDKKSKELKENPKLWIELFSDRDGMIKVYFDSVTYLKRYKKELACCGSTERLAPSDIMEMVPKEKVSSITNSGVLVNIRAGLL